MKKTMKKTLAILVAILMIVTTVPMAFAAEGETRDIYLYWYFGWHIGGSEVRFFDSMGNEVPYESEAIEDNFDLYRVPADAVSYSFFFSFNESYHNGTIPENVDYYDASTETWFCSHKMETSGVKNCRGQVCEICGKNYGAADPNAHNWSNCDAVCANGCGTICFHDDEEGEFCSVCGTVIGYELADFSELSVAMQFVQILVDSRFADDSEKARFNERLASELEEIYGRYPYLRLQQYSKEEQATVDAAVAEVFAMCEAANADLLAGEYGLAISYYTYYLARYEYSKYEFDKGMTEVEFEIYCKEFFSEEVYENIGYTYMYSEESISYVEEWLASGEELDWYAVELFYEASFAIKELYENMAACLLAKEHTYTACSTVTERPVYDEETDTWSKGTCLLACEYCGRKSSETVSVDRGDYSAYEEAASGLRELLATENLLTAVRDGYTITLNSTEANFPKNLTALEQSYIDSQAATLNGYADYIGSGIADGSLIKADYSPLKVLLDKVMELIDNKPINIIGPYYGLYGAPEGYYTGSVNSSVEQSAKSQKDYIERFTANLEELIPLLENGTALSADYTEVDKDIEALDEKLAGVTLTEEATKKLEEAKAELEKMKQNSITSAAELAEVEKAVDEIVSAVEKCLADEHTIAYEVIDEATCYIGATEAGTCTVCGEYKQRGVADSIVDHTDEDGDLLCDFGCGHQFGAEEEPDVPDAPAEGICPFCGREAHENTVNSYICILITFIKLVISIVNAAK